MALLAGPSSAFLLCSRSRHPMLSAASSDLLVSRQHAVGSLRSFSSTCIRKSWVSRLGVVSAQSRAKCRGRSCLVVRCSDVEEPTVDNSTVLVVGGGGVGLETMTALSKAGSWITGYQRSDKYRKDIESLGAMLALGDVLDTATIDKTLKSNEFDAIVCTVGGGTSDPEVDKQGPINLIDAAKKAGVKRFIMISSIGTGDSRKAVDDRTYGVLEKVLLAKEVAENHLKESDLDWTIIRPGGLLSGAPPSGKGGLTEDTSVSGLISRTDVASLVLKIIFDSRTYRKTFSAVDVEKIMPPGRPTDNIEFLSLG